MAEKTLRRNKKVVDYSQFGGAGDDDEDFASAAVPSRKKLKKKKGPKEGVAVKKKPDRRVALDEKLYQRHLEVALALSVNEPPLSDWKEKASQEEAPDGNRNESGSSEAELSQEAAAAKLRLLTEDGNGDAADSSEPGTASPEESESDSDLSEDDCDEFVVKKKKKQSRRKGGKLNGDTRKQAPEPSKQKTPCLVKSQPALPKASIEKPLKTSSPLAAKKPIWRPPAASGNPPKHLERVPATSPTQGLRLGLSRLARVKPLHSSLAST